MTEQDIRASRPEDGSETVLSPEDNGTMFGVTGLAIEILVQFARRKRLIAIVTGASMFVGLLFCILLPIQYKSVTKIMPQRQTQSTTTFLNSMPGGGVMSDAMSGGLNLRDPNAIYIGLLKSRPIADAIINTFNLTQVYRVKDMTAARKQLQENTEIVSELSTLISISVTGKDKKLSADIANAYTDQLRALSKAISVTEASKRRLFFEDQLKSQKDVLIAAEVALQQVEQNKGLIHLDMQAGSIIGGLAMLRGQISAKQVELQALRSYSTEHNPEVQLAENELASMQKEAAQMKQTSPSSGDEDMGLKDIPQAGLDIIRAERELHYQQAFFDTLLRQYEAARLDEAKEAAVIQVVEPAIQPERKSSPHRMVILLLSLVGGFFASCLLTWILWWRDVARSDEEIARAVQNLKYFLRS